MTVWSQQRTVSPFTSCAADSLLYCRTIISTYFKWQGLSRNIANSIFIVYILYCLFHTPTVSNAHLV